MSLYQLIATQNIQKRDLFFSGYLQVNDCATRDRKIFDWQNLCSCEWQLYGQQLGRYDWHFSSTGPKNNFTQRRSLEGCKNLECLTQSEGSSHRAHISPSQHGQFNHDFFPLCPSTEWRQLPVEMQRLCCDDMTDYRVWPSVHAHLLLINTKGNLMCQWTIRHACYMTEVTKHGSLLCPILV